MPQGPGPDNQGHLREKGPAFSEALGGGRGGGGHCYLVIILWEGFIEHLPSICHCDLRTRAVDTVGFFRNTLYWPENSLVSESTIRNALCFWDREAAGQG